MGAAEVICGEDRLSMRVCKSKTDCEVRGEWILAFAIPGSPLCPVVDHFECMKIGNHCQDFNLFLFSGNV